MTVPVTYGIRLPNSGPFASPDALRGIATHAEALGFDTIWVHDHLAWPTHRRTHFAAGSVEAVTDQRPDFYESLSTLAYLAGMTRRVRIGVAGLVLPWRDPRALAKQLATIDAMSGGRLIAGLAIGRFKDEFDAQQVPHNRRGRITDEYMACLHAILGPAAVTEFHGELVTIEGAEYFPKSRGLAIWVCGQSPQAHRRVARFARGWLPGGSVAEYAENTKALAAVLADAGRSLDEIERGVEIFTAVAGTDAAAHDIARASLVHQSGDVARGAERSLVGRPATVAGRMREYVAAGVTHFELKFICHTIEAMKEMMRTYAEAIVPKVSEGARW